MGGQRAWRLRSCGADRAGEDEAAAGADDGAEAKQAACGAGVIWGLPLHERPPAELTLWHKHQLKSKVLERKVHFKRGFT